MSHYKIREISFTNEKFKKETNFICSRLVTHMGDGNIYVSQYRKFNNKFPKGFILNKYKNIIWSTKSLEQKYCILNSNATYDGNILIYIKSTNYDLLECTLDGHIINKFNLKTLGLKNVYYFYKTHKNTILISSINDHKVMEIDYNNNILFDYSPGKEILYEPRCVYLTKNNTILIPDSKNHYVIEVNKSKEIIWQYGIKNTPGYCNENLLYPYMVMELPNNNIMLVEHQSNKITEITRSKKIVWKYGNDAIAETHSPRKNYLNGPNCISLLTEDKIIISDSMNGRIIILNRNNNNIIYEYGAHPAKEFILNFPRSVQVLQNDNFLIADSRNNRIVEIDSNGKIYFEYGSDSNLEHSLKWPRCVLKDESNGIYFISDGYNQRFLLINEKKDILMEIKHIYYKNKIIHLEDPHSIINIENDKMLITDSATNLVAIIDKNLNVKWMYEIDTYPIDDPHYAVMMNNSILFIVDTNNNRLLKIDTKTNKVIAVIEFIYDEFGNKYTLNKPKWIDVTIENKITLLDSQNNCLIILNTENINHPIIEKKTDSIVCNSRWAYKKYNKYFISDFWQHKLLEIEFT